MEKRRDVVECLSTEARPSRYLPTLYKYIFTIQDLLRLLKIILHCIIWLALSFQMMISCEAQFFRIIVNGNQTNTYKHRHPHLQQIDVLEVGGDVTLTSVMF